MITKSANIKNNFLRKFNYTKSAREAWGVIIEKYKVENSSGTILLPSYIGWSAHEGSGIFDSVYNSGLNYEFYNLNGNLRIDFFDLQSKSKKYNGCLVLLVHYFGFIDNNYNLITNWLDNNNIFYVEDCAHAWLSDLIGGVCGRRGKFSFYSLHKLLPMRDGGLIVQNRPNEVTINTNPFLDLYYDLYSIHRIRRQNYIYLLKLLENVSGIEIIYPELPEGICPQTLPIILINFDRDELYFKMNEAGFGLVSLYHTMIKELKDYNSEASLILSRKIINLPIHQDVTFVMLDNLVEEIKKYIHV